MATTNYEIIPTATSQWTSFLDELTLDNTLVWVGSFSFLLGSGSACYATVGSIQGVADAGNGHIIEFGFATSDGTPGIGEAWNFYRHSTLDPFTNLGLGFNDSGHMIVTDDAGTTQGTYATPLTENTRYNIAFYFEVASGTSGKLGPVYLATHGGAYSEVIAQVTGLDTFDSDPPYQDEFVHNSFGAGGNTVNLGWARHISGATSISDMIGPPSTYPAANDLAVGQAMQMMITNRLSRRRRKKLGLII